MLSWVGMLDRLQRVSDWLLGPEAPAETPRTRLLPRWIFLRALGVIYLSAFYSWLFQVRGLNGPQGILPAGEYLKEVANYCPGLQRLWFAPTLFWLGASDRALMLVCWLGLLASVAVIQNLWPRVSLAICLVCFLSFVAAAQEFSSYQSDGMLLEAGFISLFFAPRGLRPGLGEAHAPSRTSRFLLQWEWFRIYFESGVVKLASHDYSWRHLTAMDDYYQNGPLPTWVGWYVQQFPHWFHAGTAFMTLAAELALVWLLFLPRRFRIICFCIVTPFQAGIILTANYTFLNYLVLSLGFLLLDDGALRAVLPARWKDWGRKAAPAPEAAPDESEMLPPIHVRLVLHMLRGLPGLYRGCVFSASTVLLFAEIPHMLRLPMDPARALEPFRIANQYGLFANMTHERYEVEFQGSSDGQNWTAYPFRYKPQDVTKPPGIYAPYQPRFEWNLWFASLENWRNNQWVVNVQARLLENSPDVLQLFTYNPFPQAPPRMVRAVISQYWFTDLATRRKNGAWWRRETLGLYAPPLERTKEGKIVISQ